MPSSKKWTAIWQDEKQVTIGRVVVGEDVEYICDFRTAAMKETAFEQCLHPYGTTLRIFINTDNVLQELEMGDPVTKLSAFGNEITAPIRIVLPPVQGELIFFYTRLLFRLSMFALQFSGISFLHLFSTFAHHLAPTRML
jgi:hypothetical protein